MKTKAQPLLLCLLGISIGIQAQLRFDEQATLFAHMVEVNPEWVLHHSQDGMNEMVSFDSEDDRIQRHLVEVIATLRAEHGCNSDAGDRVCTLMDQL